MASKKNAKEAETTAAVKPLTPAEWGRLVMYEEIIEAGLQTMLDTAEALLCVREERLYREKFATFDDYCRDRWQISYRRAKQLIDFADVCKNLKELNKNVNKTCTSGSDFGGKEPTDSVPMPENERQTRPLAGLTPEEQQQVWSQVVSEGNPTAAKVERAAEKLRGMNKEQKLAAVQESEAEIHRKAARGLYRQIARFAQRGIQTANQIGPEAEDVAELLEAAITLCCDRGNFDRPQDHKKKGRKKAA